MLINIPHLFVKRKSFTLFLLSCLISSNNYSSRVLFFGGVTNNSGQELATHEPFQLKAGAPVGPLDVNKPWEGVSSIAFD